MKSLKRQEYQSKKRTKGHLKTDIVSDQWIISISRVTKKVFDGKAKLVMGAKAKVRSHAEIFMTRSTITITLRVQAHHNHLPHLLIIHPQDQAHSSHLRQIIRLRELHFSEDEERVEVEEGRREE